MATRITQRAYPRTANTATGGKKNMFTKTLQIFSHHNQAMHVSAVHITCWSAQLVTGSAQHVCRDQDASKRTCTSLHSNVLLCNKQRNTWGTWSNTELLNNPKTCSSEQVSKSVYQILNDFHVCRLNVRVHQVEDWPQNLHHKLNKLRPIFTDWHLMLLPEHMLMNFETFNDLLQIYMLMPNSWNPNLFQLFIPDEHSCQMCIKSMQLNLT